VTDSLRVAVIGGGIIGTATAAFLAEGGARVTVHEREALAAGASGRNSGVIQHPFDPALGPLYRETLEHYRRLAGELGRGVVALDRPPAGMALVSHEPAAVEALARALASSHPHLAPAVLDDAEVRRLEPSIAPGVWACRLEMAYPVVPSAPTYAYATLAERRGATIRLGRAAKPAIAAGRCIGVEVAGRVEPADAVVVAAGPWSPEIVDPSGAWRPISPLWGVVVETLLADPPGHVIEEAELDAALGTGHVLEDAGEAADGESGFSLVTAAGVSAVGSTFLSDEPDPAAWTERLVLRGASFVPGLLDAPIRDVHACARPLAIDGRPVIGAVPWLDGLFVASGNGPWGISTGPATARRIADLVLGRDAAVDPVFRVDRFALPAAGAERTG
jgi:glycine/D-amino acid oxidase-like deaminating enzyme